MTLQDLGFQTDFAVYLQIRQTWLAFGEHSTKTARVAKGITVTALCTVLFSLFSLPLLSLLVIILAIVEAIIILLLIFLRKRILIAVALIKEASK